MTLSDRPALFLFAPGERWTLLLLRASHRQIVRLLVVALRGGRGGSVRLVFLIATFLVHLGNLGLGMDVCFVAEDVPSAWEFPDIPT